MNYGSKAVSENDDDDDGYSFTSKYGNNKSAASATAANDEYDDDWSSPTTSKNISKGKWENEGSRNASNHKSANDDIELETGGYDESFDDYDNEF